MSRVVAIWVDEDETVTRGGLRWKLLGLGERVESGDTYYEGKEVNSIYYFDRDR